MAKSKPSRVVWNGLRVETDRATGLRGGPRGADLVDPDDRAYRHIIEAAMQLSSFGFDLSDPDIAIRAIEVGQANYASDPRTLAQVYARDSVKARYGPAAVEPTEVVYYMRIGNRVKIGWSTNLAARLATINPEELMAVEPGDRVLEGLRHREFGDLRTHGEWFRYEDRLVEHVQGLQEQADPGGKAG